MKTFALLGGVVMLVVAILLWQRQLEKSVTQAKDVKASYSLLHARLKDQDYARAFELTTTAFRKEFAGSRDVRLSFEITMARFGMPEYDPKNIVKIEIRGPHALVYLGPSLHTGVLFTFVFERDEWRVDGPVATWNDD